MSSESTQVTQPIQPIQPKANSPVARRALLVTAGLGACAAGAAATPFVAGKVQEAINQGIEDGIQQGRQAVLNEMQFLEGVPIELAINIAEWTRVAVNFIALPVARLAAGIGAPALQGFADALSTAQDVLGKVGQHITQIDQLHDMVISWKTALSASPEILSNVANNDITSAEKYLRALKAKIEHDQAATPTTTPTK
jgi:hypothetical protein